MAETKTLYKLIKTTQKIDELSFETYGIAGKNITFPDVSTEQTIVEEMIERMNREELEECHLLYVIEDELNR